MAVQVSVEWGYELHTIILPDKDWKHIESGGSLEVDGEGYSYEGDNFLDTWIFSGGIEGELLVLYKLEGGEICDEGTGFTGRLADTWVDMDLVER